MHYLAEHQTFDSTAKLNAAVYEHIKRNTYELNDTDRLTLKTIARYAVKIAGAAHLKADTLANLIGKSVKTARRVVNKLAFLSIIKKIATTRKINGGRR
ncbi:helix-turn-helix domain-containing protein [Bacillus changyiensis]|uniref:helix-turn-helix domain-containing protein n=1 Tax=Bacillus changyiensis TaxID=3004103 RepID=UPI0022E33576|nr:helix-turn-helix domain-containing protein [Bacillus changyiensis]MDA1477488.1 helix-turn-helix domain-containing protein [Bacillus changyiensis]